MHCSSAFCGSHFQYLLPSDVLFSENVSNNKAANLGRNTSCFRPTYGRVATAFSKYGLSLSLFFFIFRTALLARRPRIFFFGKDGGGFPIPPGCIHLI